MWLYVLHEEAPGVGEHEGPLTMPLRLCKGFPGKKKKKGSSWEPTPPRQIYRDLSEFGIKNTLCKGRPGNKITERNATRLAQRMFEKYARSDRRGRSSWATRALQAILRHWTGSYSVIGNNCFLNMDET